MIVGDAETREVLALKRVGMRGSRVTADLALLTPENEGNSGYLKYSPLRTNLKFLGKSFYRDTISHVLIIFDI